MLKTRKGIGTGTIMKLVLALMTASLFIGAGTVGDLGSALGEGFSSLGESTDYRIDLGDNGAEKLSQAARFVRMRAGNDGCAEDSNSGPYSSVPSYIEDEGFPALRDSYIGEYPTCESSTSTLSRGIQGGIQELGQDQEGIYSRVAFEVKEEFTITSNGDTWLEGGGDDSRGIRAVAEGSLESNTLDSCGVDALDRAIQTGAAGAVLGASTGIGVGAVGGATIGFVSGGVGNAIAGAEFVGTDDKYVIFVRPDQMDQRTNGWINDAERANGDSFGYGNRLYCHGLGDEINLDGLLSEEHLTRSPLRAAYIEYYGSDVRFQFCPGDEGYIQMNKGKPQNDAEAGEDLLGGAHKFPFIVITDKGDNCGDTSANVEENVADDVSPTGNMFFVAIDSSSSYVDSNPNSWSLHDDSEGANVDGAVSEGGATDDIEAPYDNLCRVGLLEEDGNIGDDGDGYVDYVKGTVIEKDGTFPELGSSSIQYRAEEVAVEEEGGNPVNDPENTYHVYQHLVNDGFDGQSISGDYSYLQGAQSPHNLELKGDMLCANTAGFSYSKWVMCDPSAPTNEITADGTTYECNEGEGDWRIQ